MSDLEYLKKYGNPKTFQEDVKRLEAGEPVQYIVGNVDFYGNLIEVTPDVLIPRFETEELIHRVVSYYRKMNQNPKRILDLGTGSGCIAITLKKIYPDAEVTAVDLSADALKVAKRNGILNAVEIDWLEGNFLEPVKGKYDLIISNPPYIDPAEPIDEKVEKYEPALALYADHHGLSCYEEILEEVSAYMDETSVLAFEIGYLQKIPLTNIAKKNLNHREIVVEQDLSGKDRFLIVTPKKKQL